MLVHPAQPLPQAATDDHDRLPGSDVGGGVARYSGTGSDAADVLEGFVEMATREAVALSSLRGDAAANATTLVVARPPLAQDFEEFLSMAGAVDEFIDESGFRGKVQVRKDGHFLFSPIPLGDVRSSINPMRRSSTNPPVFLMKMGEVKAVLGWQTMVPSAPVVVFSIFCTVYFEVK